MIMQFTRSSLMKVKQSIINYKVAWKAMRCMHGWMEIIQSAVCSALHCASVYGHGHGKAPQSSRKSIASNPLKFPTESI